jgi:HD-GYP domain-containing protein (c-di-GMP phosphodiesterase class II)
LAEACTYEQGFIDLIFLTGTLHDVGKIGVPDAALKKPGKLSDEEFEMIKLHPALGEKIVRQIPELADTLPGIRGHHERWDGRGYPDQLSGESIPLIARILAIADTYDAMTSDRPYRNGLSAEIAIDAIENGSGSQFDPELAQIFVKLYRETKLKEAA